MVKYELLLKKCVFSVTISKERQKRPIPPRVVGTRSQDFRKRQLIFMISIQHQLEPSWFFLISA